MDNINVKGTCKGVSVRRSPRKTRSNREAFKELLISLLTGLFLRSRRTAVKLSNSAIIHTGGWRSPLPLSAPISSLALSLPSALPEFTQQLFRFASTIPGDLVIQCSHRHMVHWDCHDDSICLPGSSRNQVLSNG